MASPYKINIPMYEGPLDLLLDLIKKHEMNIHDIQISTITSQYLDYLHKLEELDVNVSAEFVYMAATLIYIKSKMLLPPDPLAGTEELEDPRADLVPGPAAAGRDHDDVVVRIGEDGAICDGPRIGCPSFTRKNSPARPGASAVRNSPRKVIISPR